MNTPKPVSDAEKAIDEFITEYEDAETVSPAARSMLDGLSSTLADFMDRLDELINS